MDYLSGLVLLFGGLAGTGRRIRAYIQAKAAGDIFGGRVRVLILTSLGSIGGILLGIQLLLDKLNHPWKAVDFGFLGVVLLAISSIRGLTNAAVGYLRARFPSREKPMGVGTFLGWVVATSVGAMVGTVLSVVLLAIIAWALFEHLGVPTPVPSWTTVALLMIGGAVVGFVIGALQARVLSPYVGGAARSWMWASVGPYTFGYPLEFLVALVVGLSASRAGMPLGLALFARAARGLLVGMFQWRILRPWSPRAAWWIVATPVGSVAGYLLSRHFVPEEMPRSIRDFAGGSLLSGLAASLLTGLVMIWLQRGTRESAVAVPSDTRTESF